MAMLNVRIPQSKPQMGTLMGLAAAAALALVAGCASQPPAPPTVSAVVTAPV
ncbi:MAG: hypothetical protein RIR43_1392, partial [Pseudomonadota bacterium]